MQIPLDICTIIAEYACAQKLLDWLLEEINWANLSSNPAAEAIRLLKKNQEKINWTNLS